MDLFKSKLEELSPVENLASGSDKSSFLHGNYHLILLGYLDDQKQPHLQTNSAFSSRV
jgi:hypothetical protein